MTQETAESAKVDLIVQRYIEVRDKIKELEAAHKDILAPYKASLEKIENFLLARMQDQGLENMKTAYGTAYTTTKTSATVAEWESLLSWVRDNDEWGMLTRGVSKDAVKAYREANNDLPPGINWTEIRAVNIRK